MRKLKLFFSWQSDVKNNHVDIKNALLKVCASLKDAQLYDIEYDESTQGESGAPVIEEVVIEKIAHCDIFVADITPITKTDKKAIPNPNVMLELGLAKSYMQDSVTLLLIKKGDWESYQLPFDINHQRMNPFSEISKLNLTEFVQMMAEKAVQNPRLKSIFDDNDETLYWDRNVLKNIKTGKYLPKVFLENTKIKQHLREFVDPILFYKLVLERCSNLSYEARNRKKTIFHKPIFELDVALFTHYASEESFNTFYKGAEELKNYIKNKFIELKSEKELIYLEHDKLGRQLESLNYVTSRICLLTTKAGQGKTNQICDLVENVLLKRRIPFVYLNGYEIDSKKIGYSFANAMIPDSEKAFADVINEVSTYCKYKRNPLILIIDGLNENPNQVEFTRNLETFIKASLKYDCVKFILTCRTEYYEKIFSDFDVIFSDRMVKVNNLNIHFDDDEQKQLIHNYLTYFQIKADFSEDVEKRLCEDLLLLRIFSEANQGKCVGQVYHIKKDNLFAEYYEKMQKQVGERMYREEGYKLEACKVSGFVQGVVEYMITHNEFFNVPLSTLLAKLNADEQRIFDRFLDENILLRKDLRPEAKGVFVHNEVINFTYDSFRDYLVSSYLLDILSYTDFETFKSNVNKFTMAEHHLHESLCPFLFVHSKNSMNCKAFDFIQTKEWYRNTFVNMIWDVNDEYITTSDIQLLKEEMIKSPRIALRLIYWNRWNSKVYLNLNIRILLDVLSTLDDRNLSEFIEIAWPTDQRGEYKSYREQTTNRIEELLDESAYWENSDTHNIFELVLYMTTFSPNYVRSCYLKYIRKFHNIEQLEQVSLVTKSTSLVMTINQLKKIL